MKRKSREKRKRPPAHEVILKKLAEYHGLLDRHRPIPRGHRFGGYDEAAEFYILQHCTRELLDVLAAMHLPEQEEPKILAALRALKVDAIGVHPAHVHLLDRLSRHNPFAGTT